MDTRRRPGTAVPGVIRRWSVALAGVALAAVVFAFVVVGTGAGERTRLSFPVTPGQMMQVHAQSGDLTVMADGDDPRHTTLEYDEGCGFKNSLQGVDPPLVVVCPEGAAPVVMHVVPGSSVLLGGWGGRLVVQGPLGAVEVATETGSVTVREAGAMGEIAVSTTAGDVDVQGLGPEQAVAAQSAGGKVQAAPGVVMAEPDEAQVRVTTESGDVKLTG